MESTIIRTEIPGGFFETATLTFQGRSFTSGGAVVTPDHIVAYTGKDGKLIDFEGHVLGTYRVTSTWKQCTRWNWTRMTAVAAYVNGRQWYGRQGDMDLIRLRPYKKTN